MAWTLVAHGGAGGRPSPEDHEAQSAGLREALTAGAALLRAGGAALDAVVATVSVLEQHPRFNAGLGSVRNAAGEVELDAAVMEGATRRAGAVAGVRRLVHAAQAAHAVLRDGRHVLLFGAEAERIARTAGVAEVSAEALLASARAPRAREGSHHGTVGAVARDAAGHLAAATSTGGLAGKLPGRVSDSALIGCGTWADDATCAVSTTGQGEYFIRTAFARAVDGWIRHGGVSLDEACTRALAEVTALGGHGGCIAVGRDGQVAMPFSTASMARGLMRDDLASPRIE
jgi:isoaspartyl peptidase/L-asparaginase-like protein (Ntn-hydrolase superfamily)